MSLSIERVALVGTGLSNHEIGAALLLSPATARTHVSHAMAKLGARDRALTGRVDAGQLRHVYDRLVPDLLDVHGGLACAA